MAKRSLKLRLELDGEQQFKAALQQLEAGSKTLRSEMARLQAEYKGNADSMEFLTAKGDILQRQLDQQKAKTAEIRKMVEESSKALEKATQAQADAAEDDTEAQKAAAQAVADADKKLQEYIQKLNYAEAAEFNLTHAIEENNAALNGNNETLTGLGETLDKIASKFNVKIPEGAKKALDGIKGLSSGTVVAMTAAAAGVVAAEEAMRSLYETAVRVASDIDDVITQSMITGLPVELVQGLQYAEPLIDVSYSTIASSLSKLTQSMGNARDGNESLMQSFADLGIEITNQDGSLRSSLDVFLELTEVLSQMDNETERNVISMELLGKSSSELNPIYVQGTEVLRGYLDAAKENYILSGEQVEALSALDDAVESNRLYWEGLERQLAAQFAPAATEALQNFQELVTNAGEALINSGIIQGTGEIFAQLSGMLKPLAELFGMVDTAQERLRPVYEILHGLAGDLAWIKDTANAVVGFLTYWSASGREKWNTALGYNAQYGKYSNLQQWNGTAAVMEAKQALYKEYGGVDMTDYGYDPDTGLYYDKQTGNYYFGHNAGGTDAWRGGLTWVGETGPELVYLPQGSQVMNAQDSRNLGGGYYVENLYATIDASSVKDISDIINVVRTARVRTRMQ